MPTATDLLAPLRHERSTEVIAGKLADLAAARFDIVAPQSDLGVTHDAERYSLFLAEPQLLADGVLPDGQVSGPMTRTALRNLAERFRIPLAYLDRLRDDERQPVTGLLGQNLNIHAMADTRSALYRFLRCEGDEYVLRAVLSNRFAAFDNEIALRALLMGLADSGMGLDQCDVEGDITQDRMRLRIAVPGIELAVPDLLGNYRMPFTMDPRRPMHERPAQGETPPVIWAGIEVANSETGQGSFSVRPRAVIAVCRNGLTRDVEFRRAHVGAPLEAGIVEWSAATVEAAAALVTSQVTDAVRTFLSVDYLSTLAEEMRAAKGREVTDPVAAIGVVQRQMTLTEQETTDVFACFARGGDMTVLGLGNAVTAAAQLAETGDRQSEMEGMFWSIVNRPQAYAS